MVKEDLLDDIIKESAPYQSPGESANLLTSHDMICTMVSIGAIVVLPFSFQIHSRNVLS